MLDSYFEDRAGNYEHTTCYLMWLQNERSGWGKESSMLIKSFDKLSCKNVDL